jgi:hypothetical protein
MHTEFINVFLYRGSPDYVVIITHIIIIIIIIITINWSKCIADVISTNIILRLHE